MTNVLSLSKYQAVSMATLGLLAWVPQATAIPLTDIFPPEGVFAKARVLPLSFGYDDAGNRKWESDWKKVVEEALKEWDDIICDTQSFFISDKYTVSFKWQDSNYFKAKWGDKYGDALGVYVKSEDEIYFNSGIPWDFTLGETVEKDKYGFKWIAKHEIGHALGIAGDWGQDEPFTDTNGNGKYDDGEPFTDVNGDGKWGTRALSWTSPDEIMWGVFDDGKGYDGLKASDKRVLRELGYHVPEPTIFWLFAAGAVSMLFARKRRLSNVTA